MKEIQGVIEDFIKKERSGIIVVCRELFGDPVLTLYMYKGKMLHATSFLRKPSWWEELLKEDTDILSSGENPFRYAAKKYERRYLDHIVEEAKRTMEEAITEILRNGWDINVEILEKEDGDIEKMFGLDVIRSRVLKERKVKLKGAVSGSIVLSLISRGAPRKEPDKEEEEEEEVSLVARAMGFSVIYVPGEEDRYGFLRTLKEFGAPLRGDFEKVRERLREIKGTLALMFPGFFLVRMWVKGKEVWSLSVDVRKVAHTLKYTEAPKYVPENLLKDMAKEYGITFVWKEGEDTVRFLGLYSDRKLRWEEFVECCETYLREFKHLIEKAVRKVPGFLPHSLKKIEVIKILQKNPEPERFKRAFLEKFGINL